MGTLVAQRRDIISFAPGYPAPDTFPWAEFQEIARELLSGRDGAVLQYGPTRGYRPLLECIAAIMAAARRRHDARTAARDDRIAAGARPGRARPPRSGRRDPRRAADLHRRDHRVPQRPGARWSASGRRRTGSSLDAPRRHRGSACGARAGASALLYVVPNFQNPTGLLIGLEKRSALLEWADRRDILIVEDDPYRDLYFEDSASEADVRPMRSDDDERPRDLLEQLLEDARARIPRRLDRRAGADRGEVRGGQTGGGPLHRHARSARRLRGMPAGTARSSAADPARALPAEARHDGRGAARGASGRRCTGRSRAAGSSCGRRCRMASTPTPCSPRAIEHGVDLRRRRGVLRERVRARVCAAVVFGAVARSNPRRGQATGRRRAGRDRRER